MFAATGDQVRYHARERAKRAAWRAMASDAPLEERCSALLRVIEAHYDRSLEASESASLKHPDFETYIPHWLRANGDCRPELATELSKRYPLSGKPRLPRGRTYWRDFDQPPFD